MESRKQLKLSVLAQLSKILSSSNDIHKVTLEACHALHDSLAWRRSLFALRSHQTGELEVIAALGYENDLAKNYYAWAQKLMNTVLKTGYPEVLPELQKEMQLAATHDSTWALAMPIRVQGQSSGVLWVEQIYRTKEGSFEEELDYLRVIALLLGQAEALAARWSDEAPIAIDEIPASSFGLIGQSPAIQEVLTAVRQVGSGQATVLLRGESGTGKELVARAIHTSSPRAQQQLVTLVCAALPETLLESALFGHEKGAFTGAHERKIGFIEKAHGSTLFLDEIGDMPYSTQVKLLRFLQEKTFTRIGGTQAIGVDVRVIAATHVNLEQAVAEGRFREDLYYRLNVVPIFLPPLRERRGDIQLLVKYFVRRFSQQYAKDIVFTADALEKLQSYNWPGNIRELENFVERLVILAPDKFISAQNLNLPTQSLYPATAAASAVNSNRNSLANAAAQPQSLHEMERAQVVKALEEAGGLQVQAARRLGITPRQLAYRMKKYQISLDKVSFS